MHKYAVTILPHPPMKQDGKTNNVQYLTSNMMSKNKLTAQLKHIWKSYKKIYNSVNISSVNKKYKRINKVAWLNYPTLTN